MDLVALFSQPLDTAVFEHAYFSTHLPLIQKVPGLRGVEVRRVERTIMGNGVYLVAIMHFDDEQTLRTAMRSPEMQAAGDNLNQFAEGKVTLVYADLVQTPA
jgi:uncharacterized protein (TIGR02118 family)